jgi:hypothetical protein
LEKQSTHILERLIPVLNVERSIFIPVDASVNRARAKKQMNIKILNYGIGLLKEGGGVG